MCNTRCGLDENGKAPGLAFFRVQGLPAGAAVSNNTVTLAASISHEESQDSREAALAKKQRDSSREDGGKQEESDSGGSCDREQRRRRHRALDSGLWYTILAGKLDLPGVGQWRTFSCAASAHGGPGAVRYVRLIVDSYYAMRVGLFGLEVSKAIARSEWLT